MSSRAIEYFYRDSGTTRDTQKFTFGTLKRNTVLSYQDALDMFKDEAKLKSHPMYQDQMGVEESRSDLKAFLARVDEVFSPYDGINAVE